jgi:peptidoglycan-N-acetylglucosamine deacetylase
LREIQISILELILQMSFIAPHYRKKHPKAWMGWLKRERYFIKTPWWIKKLYPGCIWDLPADDKTLYLSFDDGPHPQITPFILSELKKYNAQATFFCLGDNVIENPDVFQQLLREGHAVGNHTMHHLNGWKTEDDAYWEDIREAAKMIPSNLFRPPYGRIRRSQVKLLNGTRDKAQGTRHKGQGTRHKGQALGILHSTFIIMWNVLAGDWDETVSPEKCYQRIKGRIKAGDIIVFHDSEKAWERMSYALPRLLEEFSGLGYKFKKIEPSILGN